MTNKLKCPFCQQELHKDPDGYYSCYTDNCSVMSAGGNGASGTESLWTALIQAKQDLDFFIKEQVRTQTALIIRTKELDTCQKDLKIATKALEEILQDESDEWFYIAKHALEKIKPGEKNEQTLA